MNIDKKKIEELVKEYTTVVKVVDRDAHNNNDRAYGGVVRSVKGKLQEYITEEVIMTALFQSLCRKIVIYPCYTKKFKIKELFTDIENLDEIEHFCKENNIKLRLRGYGPFISKKKGIELTFIPHTSRKFKTVSEVNKYLETIQKENAKYGIGIYITV